MDFQQTQQSPKFLFSNNISVTTVVLFTAVKIWQQPKLSRTDYRIKNNEWYGRQITHTCIEILQQSFRKWQNHAICIHAWKWRLSTWVKLLRIEIQIQNNFPHMWDMTSHCKEIIIFYKTEFIRGRNWAKLLSLLVP